MLVIGLAGAAGVGKDTIADYMAQNYGFIKFAWSDPLYQEVAAAFGVAEDRLRDRRRKEFPLTELLLDRCLDEDFRVVARRMLAQLHAVSFHNDGSPALSPRQVLQWWGTEYRRAQDPDYWVKRCIAWLERMVATPRYAEHRPRLFVECGTRFENERAAIHCHGGNVWHIHREAAAPTTGHISEDRLPVLSFERELFNAGGLPELYQAIDILLTQNVQHVRIVPKPEIKTPDVEAQ